jgi:hypothetical protein
MIRKMLLASSLPFFLLVSGCDKIANEIQSTTNKWSLGERVDKITNAKTLVASAKLVDDASHTKYVDTEIVCANGKEGYIEFTLHTKDDKTNTQSSLEVNKDLVLLRMRSGESKFNKLGGTEFANQVTVPFEGMGAVFAFAAGMLGASAKPLAEELIAPELYVEIPSKYGSPVVLIKLEDPSIQSVLKSCSITPAYQQK